MSQFDAEGTLVIENIEGADAALEDEFAVSASSAAQSGGGRRGSRKLSTAVDHLDRGVDLDETRNDLLRDLIDTNEAGDFSISRGLKRLGKVSAAGAVLTSGALSALAVSESPDQGPQPEPQEQAEGTPGTGETAVVDPVAVTAAAVISQGATVTPADIIQAKVAVTAADVIASEVSVSATDVIAITAELAAGDVVGAAAEVAATDIVQNAVSLDVDDVLPPLPEISTSDILKGLGLGAAGVAASEIASGGGVPPSAKPGSVGAPPVVLPKLLEKLDGITGTDVVPERQSPSYGSGSTRSGEVRVENTNDVTVENDASLGPREKQNIIDETVKEIEKQLAGGL